MKEFNLKMKDLEDSVMRRHKYNFIDQNKQLAKHYSQQMDMMRSFYANS